MRKIVILFVVLLLSMPTFAQLEVKEGSFKEVPGFVNINPDQNYQTDDNELPFAVIKVRTENITDKQRRELKFGGNAGTFILLEYKDGEVWVYLTAKYAEYLKISHPDFSSIEFTIPFDLEPKKGYEMTLVNKTAYENVGTCSLTIKTKPENDATIKINEVVVSQTSSYVNDMMGVGTYEITVSKDKYQTVTKTVKLEKDAKEVVEIEMVYDMANITINVDNDAEVYIDGYKRRKGTWVGELSSGTHEIECRKLYHNPDKRTITVIAGQKEAFTLIPTPIYGKLEINTEPSGATVFIDNKNYGQTPLVLNSIIIGTHEMLIENKGFMPVEKMIFLDECNKLDINEKLLVGMTNRTFIINGTSFEMISVEGGTIKRSDYYISLSDFYIGKFEVTQDIWEAVTGEAYQDKMTGDCPRFGISWNEAVLFCNELSKALGRTPYYNIIDSKYVKGADREKHQVLVVSINEDSNGFRLPTEAEWEYAASGGKYSKGYILSGSNNFNDVVSQRKEESNYGVSFAGVCNPVGTKAPNELGIYDMSGNVWEWCYDKYGKEEEIYENQINPTGSDYGLERVIRGGGVLSQSQDYYIHHRNKLEPDKATVRRTESSSKLTNKGCETEYRYYYDHTGFRLVLNN